MLYSTLRGQKALSLADLLAGAETADIPPNTVRKVTPMHVIVQLRNGWGTGLTFKSILEMSVAVGVWRGAHDVDILSHTSGQADGSSSRY
jgi:hypothetical protein